MRLDNILKMLEIDDFYRESKNIDTAKGINEFTIDPKKLYKQKLRQWLRKR